MSKQLATATMIESEEYGDITLRIFTERGSFPVLIVSDNQKHTTEDIGRQILEGFRYYIDSEIFKSYDGG